MKHQMSSYSNVHLDKTKRDLRIKH